LHAAQSLAGAGDIVNVLEFRLTRPELAAQIAPLVEQSAGQGFSAATWMEEKQGAVPGR